MAISLISIRDHSQGHRGRHGSRSRMPRPARSRCSNVRICQRAEVHWHGWSTSGWWQGHGSHAGQDYQAGVLGVTACGSRRVEDSAPYDAAAVTGAGSGGVAIGLAEPASSGRSRPSTLSRQSEEPGLCLWPVGEASVPPLRSSRRSWQCVAAAASSVPRRRFRPRHTAGGSLVWRWLRRRPASLRQPGVRRPLGARSFGSTEGCQSQTSSPSPPRGLGCDGGMSPALPVDSRPGSPLPKVGNDAEADNGISGGGMVPAAGVC